jgi:prepilin-type processing-associated H-X9-DG protein
MPNPPTIDYGSPERRKQITLTRLLIVVGLCSLVILVFLPIRQRVRDKPPEFYCGSRLRTIGQAIALYAADNAGHYPPDLQTVLTTQQITSDTFICPTSSDTKAVAPAQLSQPGHCSYIYIGADFTDKANPDSVVAIEDPANHRLEKAAILFADGHVEFLDLPHTMQILNDLAAGRNPPSQTTTFTQSSAEKDYNQHWKSRMPQLKTGLWPIPTTQPAAR